MEHLAGQGHDMRILDSPGFSQAFEMEYEAAKAGASGSAAAGAAGLGMHGSGGGASDSNAGTPGAKKRKLGKDGEIKRTRQSRKWNGDRSCEDCLANIPQ